MTSINVDSKLEPVIYVIGEIINYVGKIEFENELRREVEIKHQFIEAVKIIHDHQHNGGIMMDGYVLAADVLYKVYVSNNTYKKLTGEEAKAIKRKIKLFKSQEK